LETGKKNAKKKKKIWGRNTKETGKTSRNWINQRDLEREKQEKRRKKRARDDKKRGRFQQSAGYPGKNVASGKELVGLHVSAKVQWDLCTPVVGNRQK